MINIIYSSNLREIIEEANNLGLEKKDIIAVLSPLEYDEQYRLIYQK